MKDEMRTPPVPIHSCAKHFHPECSSGIQNVQTKYQHKQ
jgi:hypothetical protein